jgi:hypothetical protein
MWTRACYNRCMSTVIEYLREIGRQGGKAKTTRKLAASHENLKKAQSALSAKRVRTQNVIPK